MSAVPPARVTASATADAVSGAQSAIMIPPPPGEGEACANPPYECAEGLRCSANVCGVGLPEGTECSGDDSCAVGLECGEVDGGPDACQPEQAFVCL